jgi:L-aminopeptidase/D-esterase-like protein
VDALVFSGGSVFGFPVADGVIQWLREHGQGEKIRKEIIPIVPQAVLFDLFIGERRSLTSSEGYHAMEARSSFVPVGSTGAGCGATVGKILGPHRATKSGAGFAVKNHPFFGVYVVLNAFGEVMDPETGTILAGVRGEKPGSFESLRSVSSFPLTSGESTTLIAAFLEGDWDGKELRYLAHTLLVSLARIVHPAESLADGDLCVIFCSGEGEKEELFLSGLYLESLLFSAVRTALESAESRGGIPTIKEWRHGF